RTDSGSGVSVTGAAAFDIATVVSSAGRRGSPRSVIVHRGLSGPPRCGGTAARPVDGPARPVEVAGPVGAGRPPGATVRDGIGGAGGWAPAGGPAGGDAGSRCGHALAAGAGTLG